MNNRLPCKPDSEKNKFITSSCVCAVFELYLSPPLRVKNKREIFSTYLEYSIIVSLQGAIFNGSV